MTNTYQYLAAICIACLNGFICGTCKNSSCPWT